MKWIGQHIWDLTSRFRNDIYFEGLAETAETRGLVVDANGKVSINPLSGDEHATHIYENVRNDEGATIPVGTPVYSKGEVGASERILVGIADASDPNKMPAIGITNTELTTTGSTRDGLATLVGVYNTNLTGFTGLSVNDVVYVAPSGGLTISKPAGTNLIQNVGIILKTNGTIIQGLQVTCIGRTNDIPNSLQLRKADGTNAGLISMTGNDMVLSNATGDVLIGSTTYQVGGDQDIFIGDGINSVDLVFEQSGAIKGYDSSVNLTFGGGGGTITFADKVNFVGGGIENEFQFNNLTADGNFELSPITTTTSGGVLNGGFLNPAAEAKQVHMPQVLNDLAGFNHWGTVTVTGLYKTRTGSPGSYAYSNPVLPGDFANAFDGTSSTAGSWYSDNGASGTVQGEGVITLEWPNEATYGLWFGLVFGSDSFVPSRIKMEAYQTDVGWRTFADLTGVSSADIGNIILRQIDGNSGTGQATNKLRFTLGHSISGSYLYFRIHTIYLANYAQGNNNLSGLGTDQTRGYHYLERYRPNYAWGHFNPGQTTTYNLGSSSYRWATGYFNSLDVTQSINIAGSISAGSSVGNLNTSAGIGQDLEYGSTAVTTLRFDSDRWRLYAGGTSAELMTLKENGNVGIGIENPASKLDVNGTIRIRTGSLLIEDTDSSNIHAEINSNSTEGVLRLRNGSNWGLIARGVSNSPRIGAYHNGDLRIYGFGSSDGADHANDDELARFNFLDERFVVNGEIRANGGTGSLSTGLTFGDGDTGIWQSADDVLRFSTASTTRVLIDSSGKVGIGTTSPQQLLDISAVAGATLRLTSTGDGLGGDATIAGIEFFGNDASVPGAGVKSSIVAKTEASLGDDSNLIFSTSDGTTNNVERVRINPSGNVGIGTTSPLRKLHVSGDVEIESKIYGAATDHTYYQIASGDYNHRFFTRTSSGASLERFRVEGGADVDSILMLNSNVGIGTTSPSEKLHVLGDLKVQTNVDAGVIHFGDTSDQTKIVGYDSSDSNARFDFFTSGSKKLTIFDSGDVGIGTDTPVEKLTLKASSSSEAIIGAQYSTTTTNFFEVGVSTHDSYLTLKNSGVTEVIKLNSDGDSYLNGGNVGIGTTSPSYKLDVNGGGVRLSSSNFHVYYGSYTGSWARGYLIQNSDASDQYGITGEFNNDSFVGLRIGKYVYDNKGIFIEKDGNVGVGTSSPSEKLEVNGKIKATDINFSGLPTSSAGLSSGDVWNDSGTLKIVS